jgi:phospholipase C
MRTSAGNGAFDRRRFLEVAIATGAGAFAAASGPGPAGAALPRASNATVRAAASVRPAGSDLGAVEHVVFLMQENRSFDHYYGTYRGVRGFDDHPADSLGPFAQPYPAGTAHPKGRLLPYRLDTSTSIAECTHDLTHDWAPQHRCRADGSMDAFVQVHTEAAYDGPEYGVLTMGYYTRADLPYYYALADAFTICDGYHCSVMGPTHPNRLMAMTGTLDPDGRHGGPVLITNSSPEARFSVDWPTMPEVLEDAGVSWKVYSPPVEL